MAHSSENADNPFSVDLMPRVSNETHILVGSDNSSLTEGDLAILNRLQFLAEKVELLERKLDDTLHNVKGSLDSDLAENFAKDYSVINSFQVNVLAGPGCKQNDPVLAEDEGDCSSLMTRETWENAETEQTTSFLIIPVGNNDKGQEACTLQSEQTLLARKTDLTLPECITYDQGQIVRPIVATVGANNRHTSTISSQLESPILPVSAEKVISERPLNQTMLSTASIELSLPSLSRHPHEKQTMVSVSDAPGRSSVMMNRSSVSPTASGGRHDSLAYGYTIGLATAKAQLHGGYPNKETAATDRTASLDHHQKSEESELLLIRDDPQREITRSVVEFTPNPNRKFQYCVARTEIGGGEAEGCDSLSEVNLDEYVEENGLADKSINTGLELSKQRPGDKDFIDSANFEKPEFLDENQNYILQVSADVTVSDRENEQIMCAGQGDASSVNEVSEKVITNRHDHYKRTQSNYDLKGIEMQMRYTQKQRDSFAYYTPSTQPQAANHKRNNERAETIINNKIMPAVYNVSANSQGRKFQGSICSGNGTLTILEDSQDKEYDRATYGGDTSPQQRNWKSVTMQMNGGVKVPEKAVDMTRKPPPVPGRKGFISKPRAFERREEFAAHEHSFEKHLRELIHPDAIGPAPAPEKPLEPLLAHSRSKELEQLSFECDIEVLNNRTVARCNPLVAEKERNYATYQRYPTHTMSGRTDSSSDSPYSSLTSVSSTLNLGQSAENSRFLFDYDYPAQSAASPRNGERDDAERASSSPSVSFISTDLPSASESGDTFCGFRLSPLSFYKDVSAPFQCGNLIRNNVGNMCQLSSPASSVDTSELSMIDSITECRGQCQYECECQTGIPSEEDFIDELKAISKYVLNARQKASTTGKMTQAQYFPDEEQGDMDIFGAHLRENTQMAVPMLVKVILRLRKHFFGTVDSKPPAAPPPQSPPTPPKATIEGTSKKQRRKISFSPSAVLLSAIGENSALEVKEVIEKEKLDVNQLSPSGRSLLHKASASGDLESIHTLIEHGALLNILDQDGFPPLHSALRKAHYKCAIFLLECGANLNTYTTRRVREFLDVTELAKIYRGNRDHDLHDRADQVPFLGTMFNTAL